MSSSRKITTSDNGNLIKGLVLNAKLITRLMADPRVNGFVKLLPVASLIYLISPIDFIPGAVMPIIGAADDVAIMWFGLNFFLELCPADVVAEHLAEITGESDNDEDIVEAEVIELDE